MRPPIIGLGAFVTLMLCLAACAGQQQPAQPPASQEHADVVDVTGVQPSSESESPTVEPTPLPDYKIVTLLPRDAIQAIFDPRFLSVDEADREYDPEELVLGVEINGDARAYSIPYLSRHEIVNDTVGGAPIAVTW